jgi:hypothetical protein
VVWWHTLLLTLAGALVGGALTAWASITVLTRQERFALAREVRVILGSYFGALVIAVAQLQRMPEEAPYFDAVGEIAKRAPDPVRKWLEAQQWASTEKGLRRTLGPEPFLAAERVVLAHAPLHVMPLPPQLREALDNSLAYVYELAHDRSAAVKERWPEIYAALADAIRAHVVDPDQLLLALRTSE